MSKSLTILVDRRECNADEVIRECETLEASVEGLSFEFIEDPEAQPDAGAFRDFVRVATASHESPAVLEWVAEELVDTFGWRVDIKN